MPSFDVVSEVNMHELTNALDQTNREVGNRFDFKGSDARVSQEGDEAVLIEAENEFQLNQVKDILFNKMAKRKLDIASLEEQPPETSGNRARMHLKLRQGIDKELGKRIVKLVKESKLKVQSQIQGEQVRISGKKRDDLQQAIALLRQSDIDQPLQFENFRD